jgi:D-alanine-D-alanine ligase
MAQEDPRFPDFPVLLKPAWEGSSKGIRGKCLVHDCRDLVEVVSWLRRDHCQPILAEEFVVGEEVTVGLIGNEPPQTIGVMGIRPVESADHFIYGLEVKRDFRRLVRYECPPRLPPAVLEAIERSAIRAFHVLGCRDVARIDFRVRDGIPYFLEANPLPGLNPESSDLVILARLAGWTYEQLITEIFQAAAQRIAATVAKKDAVASNI